MSILKHIILLLAIITTVGTAQNWQIHGKMPRPVSGAQIFIADTSIYILGGYSDSLQQPVDWIQVYNPVENTWSLAGTMNTPRYGFVAARATDSIIFLCGGVWTNSDNVSTLEQWQYNTIDWVGPEIRTSNGTFNRVFASGYIFNNQLFLFGGLPSPVASDPVNLSYIVRYQLNSAQLANIQDTLYNVNSFPYHQMSVQIENLVYLFGGVYFGISNRIFEFNLNTFSYRDVGGLTKVRAGGSVVQHEDRVYLIGGYNESNRALSSIDIFTINTRISSRGPQLNFGRTEPMAVRYGEDIYVFGGKDQFGHTIPWIETLPLTTTTSSVENNSPILNEYHLYQNYPNPFNAATTIHFSIPRSEHVKLNIYTIDGRHISQVKSGFLSAGTHRERWDGNDMFGNAVASGIYVYKLQTGSYLYARKMILIR
jgi:N-acetylneuraminic acid mutarotase